MARRMYDLDNGTEDIKVKKILLEDNAITISKDDSGDIRIINQTQGITLINGVGFELYLGDIGIEFYYHGERILATNLENHTLNVPFYFSPYTTDLRPTDPTEGAVIYDSTLKKCILYNGTAWVNLDGTALS